MSREKVTGVVLLLLAGLIIGVLLMHYPKRDTSSGVPTSISAEEAESAIYQWHNPDQFGSGPSRVICWGVELRAEVLATRVCRAEVVKNGTLFNYDVTMTVKEVNQETGEVIYDMHAELAGPPQ